MEDKLNVKDQIKIILEFANSDEQVYLKQTNFELYKYRFESNFSEFNEKFLLDFMYKYTFIDIFKYDIKIVK